MQRLVEELDAQPLKSLLASLPGFDLDEWWRACAPASGYNMAPTGLKWPSDLRERIACRLLICRRASEAPNGFLKFAYDFIGFRGDFDGRFRDFLRLVVDPLVRDVEQLARQRTLPAVLDAKLARAFPPTGDDKLDDLLQEARDKFRDLSPVVRKDGLDRLWDSWERLKSLRDPTNKKLSVRALLEGAASTPEFGAMLEDEANALTEIGNAFHIRHFEVGRYPLGDSRDIDYLFHRLSALIWRLLDRGSSPPVTADDPVPQYEDRRGLTGG